MPEPVVVPTSGTPAAPASGSPPATPAPDSAPQTPAASPAATPGAPASAPATPVTEGISPAATPPATPADSGTPPAPGEPAELAAKRLKDTQAALTRASEANKRLAETLKGLGWKPPVTAGAPPAGQPPPASPPPAAAVPPPGAPPTPTAPAPARYQIDAGVKKDLFAKYQGAANDEEAFGVLLEETTNLLMQHLPSVLEDRLIDAVVNDKQGRVLKATQSHIQQQAAVESVVTQKREAVESFWKESLPQIPARFLWQYAAEAESTHPGDVPAQALHCVQRVLEELGPILTDVSERTKLTEGIQRGQGALLPGGTGTPAAGGGERPLSLVDQMKQANRAT